MIAEALLLVTGSGALAFWLGVLRGRRAPKAPVVKPPTCSCEHGYGSHDDEGCHDEHVVELFKDQLVKDEWGDKVPQRLHWSELRKCSCRRFDGEVPAYLFGMQP